MAKPELYGNGQSNTVKARLFNTRYSSVASNTIDYWMTPDDLSVSSEDVTAAIRNAPVLPDVKLGLYLHVPFCAQMCRFCAFSGGNSLELSEAKRYAELLSRQLKYLLELSPVANHPIESVNIGGGSPDLLQEHIGDVLETLHQLPGFTSDTEVSVEFTLSTTRKSFIDQLVAFNVTKASFGIQSFHPDIREYVRQPKSVKGLDRVLDWLGGEVPIINADLITGLPGQDLAIAQDDLLQLIHDPRINSISSYLLTPGAAPALVAAVQSGRSPKLPSQEEQARMRLQTYGTLLRSGWVRRGTNTYVDPARLGGATLNKTRGNECIGAEQYESFLLGVGPQAVSSLPGVRAENIVDFKSWCDAVEANEPPFFLKKCSLTHQRDMALWVFPLRWEGLPMRIYDEMKERNWISDDQVAAFEQFQSEGLIVKGRNRYELSLIGEVFMGHLVRDLKTTTYRAVIDEYIEEGFELGTAVAEGRLDDKNDANNRQLADRIQVSVAGD